MSFFSDLFEGKTKNLGNDITGMFRPNEIGQTLGGAAAIAAAPFALAAAPELLAAGGSALSGLGGALGFGGEAVTGAGEFAGLGGAAADMGGALSFADAAGGEAAGGGASGAIDALLSGGGGGSALPLADAGGAAPGLPSSFGGAPMGAWTGSGAAPAGGGSFIDKLVSGVEGLPGAVGNQIARNPLGVIGGGGLLAYNLMQGQRQLPEQWQLQGQANQLTQQGQQFMSYLQTGTLPAGLQAAVDRATQAAKAQIIANAARNGLSTDPTQNTALAQDLASADRNALIAVAQEGEQLFQAGANEVQLSSQILERLLQVDREQTASMGKAIANFAGALSGGGGGKQQSFNLVAA